MLPLLTFHVTVFTAASTGGLSALQAVALGTSGNVFFSMRMLAMRIDQRRPKMEAALVVAVVGIVAGIGLRGMQGTASQLVVPVVVLTIAMFAMLSLRDARHGVRMLRS